MKRRNIVGWILGILTFAALMKWVVPDLTCADGWKSASIGRSGACSWHGGVERSPLGFLAIIAGVIVGAYAAALPDKWRRWRETPRAPADTIQTPYGTLREYEQQLRTRGIPEEQIAIEVEKYQHLAHPKKALERTRES